jgi:predicted nucleotidyltransferase
LIRPKPGPRNAMVEGIENRIRLLNDELERFVDVASKELGAEKVILFGSLAGDGSIDEWSDLDLVIIAGTDLPFYRRIEQLLRGVRPRVGVDVFVYTPEEWEYMKTERPFIRDEAVKRGRVVYERAGE